MANIIKFSAFLEKKQKSETSKLLKKNGIGEDVNRQNNRGWWSPLMRAVLYEEAELVKILINAGADVNFKAYDENTPLVLASTFGHAKIVKLLIEAGADVNLKDYYENTPLMIASIYCHTDIIRMLLDAGADRTLKNKYEKTAFDYIRNNQEILDIFDAYNEEYIPNYNI